MSGKRHLTSAFGIEIVDDEPLKKRQRRSKSHDKRTKTEHEKILEEFPFVQRFLVAFGWPLPKYAPVESFLNKIKDEDVDIEQLIDIPIIDTKKDERQIVFGIFDEDYGYKGEFTISDSKIMIPQIITNINDPMVEWEIEDLDDHLELDQCYVSGLYFVESMNRIIRLNLKTQLNYLSSNLSLKTTDELIVGNLLPQYNNPEISRNSDINVKLNQERLIFYNNSEFLCEIDNLLTKQECKDIIDKVENKTKQQDGNNTLCFGFQNMNNKYESNIRSNERIIVKDNKLADLLFNRLNDAKIFDKISNVHKFIPLGFDVIDINKYNNTNNNENFNDWHFSNVNEAFRINKYGIHDFFSFHKDSQYVCNADTRSIFSLIIYLNDDFDNGNTNFYFNKKHKINDTNDGNCINYGNFKKECKDWTIKEEIDYFGGIKSGVTNDAFECQTIYPKQGKAILFTHALIHEAIAPLALFGTGDDNDQESRNTFRYIIKSDIIMTRKCNEKGFAVSSYESKDYIKCLNYFRDAQRQELLTDKIRANILYERALSIRYCYPMLLFNKVLFCFVLFCSTFHLRTMDKSLLWCFVLCILLQCDQLQQERSQEKTQGKEKEKEKEKKKNRSLLMNVDSIWMVLFDYLGIREIECIGKLFPHLACAVSLWKKCLDKKSNTYDNNSNNDKNKAKHIPKLLFQHGTYNVFEFDDFDFFIENKNQCLKVIAMYTLYLFSQRYFEETAEFFATYYSRDDIEHIRKEKEKMKPKNYYVAKYNQYDQTVLAITLHQMLNDIFYGYPCYGSYFKIKKQTCKDRDDCKDNKERNKAKTNELETKECDGNSTEVEANENEMRNEFNIKCDFDRCVDRKYMTLCHGSQFLGGNGFSQLEDSTFVVFNDRGEYCGDPDVISHSTLVESLRNEIKAFKDNEYQYSETVSELSAKMNVHSRAKRAKNAKNATNENNCKSEKTQNRYFDSYNYDDNDENEYEDGLYDSDEYDETNIKSGCCIGINVRQSRLDQECDCFDFGRCPKDYGLSPYFSRISMDLKNHLICDFSRNELKIYHDKSKFTNGDDKKNDNENENKEIESHCANCDNIKNIVKLTINKLSQEQNGKNDKCLDDILSNDFEKNVKYAIVNIESLYNSDNNNSNNFDLSFSHAGCQGGHPYYKIKQANVYVGYSHLNHIHCAYLPIGHSSNKQKQLKPKVMVWAMYNGIVAL